MLNLSANQNESTEVHNARRFRTPDVYDTVQYSIANMQVVGYNTLLVS